MNSAHFILSLDNKGYKELKQTRSVTIPRHDNLGFERGSIILVYLKDRNKVVAEYDIESFHSKGRLLELELEPIYNAPSGTKLTDIILMTLTSYKLEVWKELLETDIIQITERDFDELVKRLKQ